MDTILASAILLAQIVSTEQFSRIANAALAAEERYAFFESVEKGRDWPGRRDPAARAKQGELEIDSSWSVITPARSGIVLETAAREFAAYLGDRMRAAVSVRREDLTNWESRRRVVVAGTPRDMPGCGPALKGPKDYRIVTATDRVVVCGFDERGAMYGLYNLEWRMSLREGPFLAADLDVTRRSMLKARMTQSGLGWMDWPDRYLAMLPRYGFDSIYLSAYVNPTGELGVPTGGLGVYPPYWDKWKTQDPARVRDVIRRAARFGIDVYCPIVFLYTGAPGFDEAALRKLVRNIVTEFPEIRGYVLLTEGFAYKGWFGGGARRDREELREWARNWTWMVGIVAEEAHRIKPAVDILAWEYNLPFSPENVEIKRYATSLLPKDVTPLLTFENGKSFDLDGRRHYLTDYSINQPGPAEVTVAQVDEARRRGLPGVFVKADTWASWRFGTFPYIPAPHQWHRRYVAMEAQRVDGTLESWSYGFKPNFVAELRAWTCWSNAPPFEDLLRAVARRDFGAGAEQALEAWSRFSDAVKLVPDTGPRWGTNNAVAAPIFFDKPRPRAMTIEHSWFDQQLWTRTARINPYWPYQWFNMMLWPDFANKTNAARGYTSALGMDVFFKYTLAAADGFEKGLRSYRRAALSAPSAKRSGALREVLMAEHMQRMLRSAQAVLEFEDLRFRLASAPPAEKTALLARMGTVARQELARTQLSLETARRDSRLGYEWEMDYVYTPDVIEEKLKVLRGVLTRELPAYQRRIQTQ